MASFFQAHHIAVVVLALAAATQCNGVLGGRDGAEALEPHTGPTTAPAAGSNGSQRCDCAASRGQSGASLLEVGAAHPDFTRALQQNPGPCTTGLENPIPNQSGQYGRLDRCRVHLRNLATQKGWTPHQTVVGSSGAPTFEPLPPDQNRAGVWTHRGWHYKVDSDGRVFHARAQGMDSTVIVGGASANDDLRAFVQHFEPAAQAGHIRARCLGGDTDLINFIPQSPRNNEGIQSKLETTVMALIQHGRCVVNVDVEYSYSAGANPSARVGAEYYIPNQIRYKVTVERCLNGGWNVNEGNSFHVVFPNT